MTMTTGEELFWQNAAGVLRDIGMPHLDPVHGAAVDIVRWCRVVRSRPTHHRQEFLEMESPALLAYLETLAESGDVDVWRTLEDRISLRAEALRTRNMRPCPRPWLAAIWSALPELAAIGQRILDQQAGDDDPNPGAAPTVVAGHDDGKGSGEGEGGDKSGSAGTTARPQPQPSSRLPLPATSVRLSAAECKAFGLDDETNDDDGDGNTPDGTEGPDGTKGPGGPKGGKK
ncbi:hypothetical protein [Hoeflea sp. BAL378]|uniref:hypothetical protein n=1 Tax=Hoeflea sp. BAL378 TaxID=1547437 RepID=UPI00126A12C1|nr:hypothetical protein [Hoeflea sp. BAL378]